MGRINYQSFAGVTLAEVLVVVGILAILVTMAAFSLRPNYQLAKARDGRRRSDLKTISTSLEDYLNDHPCYPENIYESSTVCRVSSEFKTYLSNIPCDPSTRKPYPYSRPDDCSEYAIYAKLELAEADLYGGANYALSSANVRVIPSVQPTTSVTSTPTSTPVPVLSPTNTPLPTATLFPQSPTPTRPPPTMPPGNFYGCLGGLCLPLIGYLCEPNYMVNDCYGQCSNPSNNCEFNR